MIKKYKVRRGFRKNKITNHPAYLVDKEGRLYKYIGITHSAKTGGENNVPLYKNPNPSDTRKAYVRPKVDIAPQDNFGRRYDNWSFDNRDKKKVNKIIKDDKIPK